MYVRCLVLDVDSQEIWVLKAGGGAYIRIYAYILIKCKENGIINLAEKTQKNHKLKSRSIKANRLKLAKS